MNPRRKTTKKTTKDEHSAKTIPTQRILEALQRAEVPCTLKILAQHLKVQGKGERAALENSLRELVKKGRLVKSRANRYGLAAKMDVVAGTVLAHPDGYAFVKPDEGGEDVYVNRRDARRVLHLDRVQISVSGVDHRGRRKGHVIEILERANHEVVGRFFRESGVGFVVPENRKINQDILVPENKRRAKDGQMVVVKIDKQPDGHSQPLGRIVEILGEHMAPGMEIGIAIRSHQLPHEWSDKLLAAVKKIPESVKPQDLEDRKDLRDLPFVTIDGEDARDFDDAVYCRKSAKGFTLFVAIADVSHYVKLAGPLDVEAYERGTSVYFPNFVLPMLPEALSNGICSLNPEVDRLVLVCEMAFDKDGQRKRAKFYDGVIHSHARLTYSEVGNWLEGESDGPLGSKQGQVDSEILQPLVELYRSLDSNRKNRGALEVETIEPLFIFNEEKKIERVEARQRNDAHKIIEECMIAANVAAAETLSEGEYPAIYRNHDKPDSEKLDVLRQFLADLGLPAKFSEPPSPESVALVLRMAKQRPDREMIETMILRSLKLAVYSAENNGHFGLALQSYCHFTSPIRRYPDLVVHRALKNRRARKRQTAVASAELGEVADWCSLTERRAEEASRDVISWLKCEFMHDKIGDEFEGFISGVTNFGIFVTLRDVFVEGLIHVTALPEDYYHYDEVRHTLSGERSRHAYKIGEALNVRVTGVSMAERKIDFELCG